VENPEKVTFGEVVLTLSYPTKIPGRWIGQQEVMDQLLAAWLVMHEHDLPLNPRLIGKPGVGKTSLAYAAGKKTGREIYIFQATMDTRPEDLIITPVISDAGKLKYVASPLVTAVIKGGACILDEGNRMSEKSWASLAPLLDHRRYVESIIAGIQIPAHPDFRMVTTMNDDASTYELPEYIHSRLQPQIFIDFPEADEEFLILKENIPFAPDAVLRYVVAFLQNAHSSREPFTVRDGINITRFALKLSKASGEVIHKYPGPVKERLLVAIEMILGKDAQRHFPKKI